MGKPETTGAEYNAALEKTGGDFEQAAALVGLTASALRSACQRNNRLRSRWLEKDNPTPPGEAVTIHRPVIPAIGKNPLSTEDQIAEAVRQEEKTFRAGLVAIGAGNPDLVTALQSFQRRSYRSILEFMSGGIAKQFLDIMAALDEINRELAASADGTGEKLPIAREMILRNDRIALLNLSEKFKHSGDKSVLTSAKVAAMSNAGAGAGKPSGKPGFSKLKKAEQAPIDLPPE